MNTPAIVKAIQDSAKDLDWFCDKFDIRDVCGNAGYYMSEYDTFTNGFGIAKCSKNGRPWHLVIKRVDDAWEVVCPMPDHYSAIMKIEELKGAISVQA